jgi:hypothetical protein
MCSKTDFVTAPRNPTPQTLMLDFQMRDQKDSFLITRSPFPLTFPGSVVAVYGRSAFEVPGGVDARIDLLYSLENEFGNWFENSRPLASGERKSIAGMRDECWIVVVTELKANAQFHRAVQLFVALAAKLIELAQRGEPGSKTCS